MPNAIIYARVSTLAQTEGASLESQIEACRNFALESGFTVIKEVKEIYSGSYLFDRPELNKCRDEIKTGIYKALIVYDIDRLSRKTSHLGILLDECERYNTELLFVKTDFANTPEGILLFSVRGYVAEIEREKIIERTTRGRRTKANNGSLSFKRKLYGYTVNPSGKREIFEPEAVHVRYIFSEFLAGKSLRAIATDLNNLGVPTPHGSVWWASTIQGMLKNPCFAGRTVIFRQKRISTFQMGDRVMKNFKTAPETHVELPAGTTPALISEQDFAAVQRLLTSNRLNKRAKPKREFLLRGRITCQCGRKMSPQVSRTYRHYQCASKQNPAINCKTKMCGAIKADEYVWDWIKNWIKKPKIIDKLFKPSKHVNQNTNKFKNVINEISALEKEIEKIVARIGLVDELYFKQISSMLETKQIELAKLKTLKTEIELKLQKEVITKVDTEKIKALAYQLGPVINEADFEMRVSILDMFDITASWDGAELHIYMMNQQYYGTSNFNERYNSAESSLRLRVFSFAF